VTKLRALLPPKWVASAAMVLLVVAGTSALALANVPPSTFEGGDGNLVVDSPGNTDWANVAGLNVGVDLPSGTGDNSFGQGTKEDNAAVTVVSGSIPPNKSDLIRFYEASELVSGQNFLYLAWERTNVLGSANMDFEINQATTPGLGNPGAHTINRTAGDLLVTYDFTNGGSTPTLGLLFWVTTGSTSQCFSSNSLPCWGNHIGLTSANSEGAINTVAVTDPIAPNAPRTLGADTFGETAINLTGAGVFPPGVCEAFGSAFLKSRSSASFTAEVKDFVAPVPVNISNCGTITIHKVTQNGDSTFAYTTTGSLSPSTFNLSNGGTQHYGGVPAGSYSVTESGPPAGWTFVSLVCGTVTGFGTKVVINAQTVSITLGPGGNVDCTYTNHTKVNPGIITTTNPSSGTVSVLLKDTATLSGGISPTGTITFKLYGPNDATCANAAIDTETASVSGNGSYSTATGMLVSLTGTYQWVASYSGDGNNNPTSTKCGDEPVVVSPASPGILTATSPSSGTVPALLNDTATLSGGVNPTGTITFKLYGPNDATCANAAIDSETASVSGNGSYSTATGLTVSLAGTYQWVASYSGDANNNPTSTKCGDEPVVVSPASPGILTATNPSSGTVPVLLKDTATLSGGVNPTGTITFKLYGPNDATCANAAIDSETASVSGNGSYSTATGLTVSLAGTYQWVASYSGDANNNPTSTKCGDEPVVVSPASPGILTATNPSSGTVPVLLKDTATLSGGVNPTGTITFKLYGPNDATCANAAIDSETASVSGNGSYSTATGLTVSLAGTYQWVASYSGDANNNPASTKCGDEPVVVSPASPTGSSTPSVIVIPDDSATLSGGVNPTGTLTFSLYGPNDATCIAPAVFSQTVGVIGNGTYSTTNSSSLTPATVSTPGTYNWKIVYSGDANNNGFTISCGTENFTFNVTAS
jgi:hypothetical protein